MGICSPSFDELRKVEKSADKDEEEHTAGNVSEEMRDIALYIRDELGVLVASGTRKVECPRARDPSVKLKLKGL